jgi:hypothetical protein
MVHDVGELVTSLVGKSRIDLIHDVRRRLDSTPQLSKRAPLDQREARSRYLQFLSGALYWLHYGRKPDNLDRHEFARLRPLCEDLIKRGDLKASAIETFQPAPQGEVGF